MLSRFYILIFRNLECKPLPVKSSFICKYNTSIPSRCALHTAESSDLRNVNNKEPTLNVATKDGESKWVSKQTQVDNKPGKSANVNTTSEFYFDVDVENLSPEQQTQKEELIRELTRKLSGPLADEDGVLPVGDKRPIAIEVDGPSHFYSNSTKYTAYTKLKHRILTRMGYKVLHVPFFEWRRLRGAREREEYMRAKLKEEPSEWLDPDDEKFYIQRLQALKEEHKAIDALKTERNT